MKQVRGWNVVVGPVLGVVAMLVLAGCMPVTPAAAPPAAVQPESAATAAPVSESQTCSPTAPDMLGPYYVPDAPERSKVGAGYVLQGEVLGAGDCQPLAGAKVEFWMADPSGQYTDDMRATLYADAAGKYAFESPVPGGYGGRPLHIHIKVSAPGYAELVTQHYPQAEQTGATFDLVLTPE